MCFFPFIEPSPTFRFFGLSFYVDSFTGGRPAELDLDPDPEVVGRARTVIGRLAGSRSVDDLEALSPNAADTDFETLARAVHASIHDGEPEVGLDRLHTFVSKFIDVLAEQEGIITANSKPLHSTFGEVIKALRRRGAIETEMAERILKSTISTFESFNEVRNQRTFAHPNPLLSPDEALLIFRHVASAIRFLRTLADANRLKTGGGCR
ncbi:MAG: abortive infection family protein [Dehalococcoidia bacterium]